MNIPALFRPIVPSILPHLRSLSSSARYISVDIDANRGIAILQMTRHAKMNALSRDMATDLSSAVASLDSDESVRAIVLSGGDRAFCAGSDVEGLHSDNTDGEEEHDWMEAIAATKTPIVAAVEGFALGPGCGLALVSDVVIAGKEAMFGVPDVHLGRIPSWGITQRLPRAVGRAKAMEMALTGRQMTADEAESAGLVSRVAVKGGAENEAVSVACVIARYSCPVVRSAKRCIAFGSEARLKDGLALERKEWKQTRLLRDYEEGIKAFKSEREAVWRHR